MSFQNCCSASQHRELLTEGSNASSMTKNQPAQNCVPSVTICTRRKIHVSYSSVSCSSLSSEKGLGKCIGPPGAGLYVFSSGARNLETECMSILTFTLGFIVWKAQYEPRKHIIRKGEMSFPWHFLQPFCLRLAGSTFSGINPPQRKKIICVRIPQTLAILFNYTEFPRTRYRARALIVSVAYTLAWKDSI